MPRVTYYSKNRRTRNGRYKGSTNKDKVVVTTQVSSRKRGMVKYGNKQVRNRVSVPVGLGFPKRMVMTHKYTEYFNLVATNGVFNSYFFSCNGMFDPNITGGGHQPLYFDQMTGIYRHYTVIGSKIIAKVTPLAATNAPISFGMIINDDTTITSSDVRTMAEQSSSKKLLIPPSSNDTYTLTNKWSAKKTFGGSILGNDALQGSSAANPTEQSYYNFWIDAGFSTTQTQTLVVEATVYYIAVWDELLDIAGS